jgi:Skp family chaperone for outer membrane proteins
MNRLLSWTLLLGLLFPAAVVADAPPPKVRFVDLSRAVRAVAAGRAVAGRLAAAKVEGEKKTAAMMQEVNTAHAKLMEEKASLSSEEAARRASANQQRMNAVWAAAEKLKNDLAAMEQRELAAVREKVKATVARLSAKEGYLYVFDGETVAWGRPELDATDDVIALHDASAEKR